MVFAKVNNKDQASGSVASVASVASVVMEPSGVEVSVVFSGGFSCVDESSGLFVSVVGSVLSAALSAGAGSLVTQR